MIWTLPFIAALVGWFTNYIAVKMLFHPKKPVNILGVYKLQGIFPKNQQNVANKMGKMVAEELLSSKDLKDRIISEDNISSIVQIIENKIEDFFSVKVPKRFPTLSRILLSEKRKERIVQELMAEVHTAVPELMNSYFGDLEEQFNVEEMITEKVNDLSSDKLEDLLMSLLEKEFKFIELIGAVIGFLIGLIQVAMVLLGGA
ncbi:MAG: DUF445 family protein [Flavobacteriales bacterium]|nr:DUF445 family protein [Flavobacteriales bacterium]